MWLLVFLIARVTVVLVKVVVPIILIVKVLVLSVVVMMELWRFYSLVMMLMKRSSVLTQQHLVLWCELQN